MLADALTATRVFDLGRYPIPNRHLANSRRRTVIHSSYSQGSHESRPGVRGGNSLFPIADGDDILLSRVRLESAPVG
jgi:hypothetical protein